MHHQKKPATEEDVMGSLAVKLAVSRTKNQAAGVMMMQMMQMMGAHAHPAPGMSTPGSGSSSSTPGSGAAQNAFAAFFADTD